MDINVARIGVTVAAILVYLAIVWWAYSPSRRDTWERKGNLDD